MIYKQGRLLDCFFFSVQRAEYDELYDWLAQSKLLAYMDNFAGAGFDLSAMAGLTAEVSACDLMLKSIL